MTIAHNALAAAAAAAAAAALRFVAPRSGSYVSEASFFNPDWSYAFWGQNYPRLRGIKARYDPGGLFFVHNGVGSEDWRPDGFERRSPQPWSGQAPGAAGLPASASTESSTAC